MKLTSLLPLLILCHLTQALAAVPTTPARYLERIEVAPDGWTFREAISHRAFVPFGTNYTPAWSGWAPDYLSAERFDAPRIEADFAKMEALGVNVCKIVFSARRMLPDPQSPDKVTLDAGCLARVAQVTDIAGRHGIRLLWTLSPDWHGFPAWFDREGRWYGDGTRSILSQFWRQFAARFKNDGRVFGYSFCVETALDSWAHPVALAQWRDWAGAKYGTLAAANKAWGTAYARWDAVPVAGHDGANAPDWQQQPEGTDANENKTNDPFLYDFLLFREFCAFRYMHAQARAVKQVDPHALTSMGFVQWNPLLRCHWGPNNDGPGQGPEYNAREMAKTFDFVGIHFYPVYPNGNDETQLCYLELWARWAFAGKPVLLEEFNQPPAAKNIMWCPRLIERSRRFVSGWLVWTFQDVPKSDNVTEVCGLLDEAGKVTPWGEQYMRMAGEVKGWKLTRQPAARVVPVDKKFLYTASHYRDVIESLLKGDTQTVDFQMESNASIDQLLRQP